MDGKQTLKYALYHEFLGLISAVLGLGLVGVGVFLGFGDSITIVLNRAPADWGDAVAAAQPVTFLALAVVGVLIWQFGKSITAVKTAERVAAQTAGEGGAGGDVDVDAVRSEVLSSVDDRVAEIESAVQENRRQIEETAAAAQAAQETAEAAESAPTEQTGETGDATATATADATADDAAGDEDTGASSGSSRRSRRRSGSGSSSTEGSRGAGDAGGSGDGGRDSASNRRSKRRSSRGSRDDDQ